MGMLTRKKSRNGSAQGGRSPCRANCCFIGNKLLGALRAVLWLQLLVAVVRGLMDLWIDPHPALLGRPLAAPDFSLAIIFVPLDLLVFIMISRLVVNAFAYTEFQRAKEPLGNEGSLRALGLDLCLLNILNSDQA